MRDTKLSRRRLLTIGGATLAAGTLGGGAYAASPGRLLQSVGPPQAPARNVIHLAGTDGWVSLPAPASPTSYDFPDSMAPEGKTTYVFGFRDVTGFSDQQVQDQKGKTQICAPLLWFDEYQSSLGNDVQVTVTNLGMQIRPDLTDGHTLHWHGFRNAIPFYDGVPEMSVSIPIGRDLTYFYQPKDPGTYMYHCHFEDVEHVQMGMTGPLFVRPRQNGTVLGGFNKFAYNDGDGSTGYDREFALLLTEMYLLSHWQDAHIQQPLWDQYKADAWLMNGRSYPDTLEPSTGFYGPTGSRPTGIAVGDPNPWPNPRVAAQPRLSHQPISSLVSCNAGERVLLRLANLGYQEHAMTVPGLVLDVIGKDATLLANGAVKTSMQTETMSIGPGESYDCLFTAPATPGTYVLYNRAYATSQNRDQQGIGGMRTEIRVHPAGTLPAQTAPNA
ncbi:MAG TPA: multicopper oxidase domain-containing protein [Gaiellales bacterium]|jgi:FtsP/CotA-like multicopper oxidase with cupredoxin domain|nr:multicopper oxidase domain-containing protein [Gaiellales bacterium]